MAQYQLTVLQPEAVHVLWEELSALIEPGLEFANGEFDLEDILCMVDQHQAFVAVMSTQKKIRLAVVFEIIRYPKKRVLHVMALGGRGLDVVSTDCWAQLKRMAALVDADSIRGAVRPSMERLSRRVFPGAKKIYTVLEQPLEV